MSESERNAIWQGTLSLMVLRTLLTMGEQHGYGIARRIEQTSQGRLSINYGTLYPALLKLEQEGLISSAWGTSENNRKAKFYRLTKAGRKQIERDTKQWETTSAIMTRFLAPGEDEREERMRVIRGWWHRLLGSFSGDRAERDLSAELESHLQLHIDDNLRAGMTPAEARRRALLEARRRRVHQGGLPRTARLAGARVARPRPALRRAHAVQESGLRAGRHRHPRPWASG